MPEEPTKQENQFQLAIRRDDEIRKIPNDLIAEYHGAKRHKEKCGWCKGDSEGAFSDGHQKEF